MAPDWQAINARIRLLMARHADALTPSTVEAVEHYLTHDEYEMAFEGLCIELMAIPGLDVDWPACIELAKALRLDRASVLDAEFWTKLNVCQSKGAHGQS